MREEGDVLKSVEEPVVAVVKSEKGWQKAVSALPRIGGETERCARWSGSWAGKSWGGDV